MKIRIIGVEQKPAVDTIDYASGIADSLKEITGSTNEFEVREFYFEIEQRGSAKQIDLELHEDDIIELEYENGLVDILSPEELEEKAGTPADKRFRSVTTRSGDETVVLIPSEIPFPEGGSRGSGFLRRAFIRIFKPEKKIARLALSVLASNFENKTLKGGGDTIQEGLYYCSANDVRLGDEFKENDARAGRHLLLIHGFGSSITGSFEDLSASTMASWPQLTAHYPKRIIGYNHRTLTKSPLENAAELMASLAPDMRLDILSHSRGGLVADLIVKVCDDVHREVWVEKDGEKVRLPLSLEQVEEGMEWIPLSEVDDPNYFWAKLYHELSGPEDDRDKKALLRLVELALEKKVVVNRLVRTACPAGGTILASKRLTDFLKVILNAVGLVPALKASVVYDSFKSLLISLVKQKDNKEVLPGIEALNPSSDFIKLLNVVGAQSPTSTELIVISGDVRFGSLWRSLSVILTDAFYWEDHDYVVDTKSMYQGIARIGKLGDSNKKRGFHYSFHADGEIAHFKYFSHPQASKRVLLGLTGTSQAISQQFDWYDQQKSVEKKRGRTQRGAKSRKVPTVILLPGIMGSHLRIGHEKVWLKYLALVFGGLGRLSMNNPNINPDGAIEKYYEDLASYLERSFNVEVFDFDWRKDIRSSAEELRTFILALLERSSSDQPIHFMAHSMGGLVVHALYSLYPDVWELLQARGKEKFRCMLLGSPLKGSPVVANIYLDRHRIFRKISLFDIINKREDLLQVVNSYTGMLQLLPRESNLDYSDENTWKDLQLAAKQEKVSFPIPSMDDRKNIAEFHALLGDRPLKGAEFYYIAGVGREQTLEEIEIIPSCEGLKYHYTERGDGTVPWSSGMFNKFPSRVYYLNTEHQALCDERHAFAAFKDILEMGFTTNSVLQDTAPQHRGSRPLPLPQLDADIVVNNQQDLLELTLGRRGRSVPMSEQNSPLNVRVTHGDLGFAEFPVMVGHFRGNDLLSAELSIDKHMNNELRDHHNLGAYPGELGESLVLINKEGLFPGVVVAGLGGAEGLSELQLEQTLTRAFIELAMYGSRYTCPIESNPCVDNMKAERYGVSALIVGSEYGGLSIISSLRAIIRAMNRANRLFVNQRIEHIKPFTDIELIELYRDKAIDVCKHLVELTKDADFRDYVIAQPKVKEGTAGLTRLGTQDKRNWWHRLQVVQKEARVRSKSGESETCVEHHRPISFLSMSDKARVEVETIRTDRVMLEAVIQDAVSDHSVDIDKLKAMYELMIPNEFKGYTDDINNLLLILDEYTASYPWELVNKDIEADTGPIVARCGFIRQLEDKNYRRGAIYSTSNNVLVIGEPKVEGWSALPAAKREAEGVARMLDSASQSQSDTRFSVTTSINETSSDVVVKLFNKDYRIIHLAGHGVYDTLCPHDSGMILDNGIRIKPYTINQMSYTPEFVFINCCFLGKIDEEDNADSTLSGEWNKLASNLGIQFIRNGVKAVICAGWAVDDTAAKVFSDTFYSEMIRGSRFGEAVTKARKRCYESAPHSTTWGAYQCYGNPFYRFRLDGVQLEQKNTYVHAHELVVKLENIARSTDAKWTRSNIDWAQEIEKELKEAENLWPELDSPEVLYRVYESGAWAYYECGSFDLALSTYDAHVFKVNPQRASIRSRGNYMKLLTSKAREDMLNFDSTTVQGMKVSDALKMLVDERSRIEQALIYKADRVGESLLIMGEKNSEAWAKLGGHFKREAIFYLTYLSNLYVIQSGLEEHIELKQKRKQTDPLTGHKLRPVKELRAGLKEVEKQVKSTDKLLTNYIVLSYFAYMTSYERSDEGHESGNPLFGLTNGVMMGVLSDHLGVDENELSGISADSFIGPYLQKLTKNEKNKSDSEKRPLRESLLETYEDGSTNVSDYLLRSPEVWQVINRADLQVSELFVKPGWTQDRAEERLNDTISIFDCSMDRGGSPRKLKVIREHYEAIDTVLDYVQSKQTDSKDLAILRKFIADLIKWLTQQESPEHQDPR